MKRLPLAVLLVITWFAFAWVAPSDSSVGCVNSDCQAEVTTSPLAIALGLVLFVAVWLLPKAQVRVVSEPVSAGRRVMGFLADLAVFVMCFGPLMALPLLFVEAAHHGRFEWSFARDFARPTDWVLLLGATAVLIVGVWTWQRGLNGAHKSSVGQFIAGYTVVDGNPTRFEYS